MGEVGSGQRGVHSIVAPARLCTHVPAVLRSLDSEAAGSRVNASVRVLGLDPGLRRTGYAVASIDPVARSILDVLNIGVLETFPLGRRGIRKTSEDLRRAKEQADGLRRVLKRTPVDLIAAEMATTTPYTLATFSFGVMVGILASLGPPIVELLPHEVKIAATGSARATKSEIIAWALTQPSSQTLDWPTSTRRNRLDLAYQGRFVTLQAEHPADALATVAACLGSEQFRVAGALLPT